VLPQLAAIVAGANAVKTPTTKIALNVMPLKPSNSILIRIGTV
jgi:hypothetical protein